MSISISSAVPAVTGNAADPTTHAVDATTHVAVQRAQAAPPNSGDVVRLSESQQVYQLYNQGQRVSQIATSLRISVEAVNSYLGISSSKG
jgi:DNA-binding NarL/FixJ family response regulator